MYYYKGHVLFARVCYTLILKCDALPLFILCTLGITNSQLLVYTQHKKKHCDEQYY